jgi:hypothetical protein
LIVVLVALLVATTPTVAFAEDGEDRDLLLRVGSDVRLPPGERVGRLIVIDGDALIEGEVAKSVVVLEGDAIVTGEISGDLTVISGNIRLEQSAQVKNVTSIRGDIVKAHGALVTGEMRERDNFGWLSAAAAVFSILFWLGLTVALVTAGLIFAAVGGRQLRDAAERMTGDAVNTILGVVFVAVALPMIAVLAIVTVIGIPLGAGLLLFLLPALWFLGYLVAATRLGSILVGFGSDQPAGHPYAATVLGVVLLQLIVLIPVLGLFIALLAGTWGAGALVFNAYRAAGGRGFAAISSAPAAPTSQPAN